MRVFVSHSHDDKQIVRRIVQDLQRHGVEVWLDEDLILPGEQWTHKITEAFENSDAILVIMSRNTVKSQWQTSEIAFAVATQRTDPSKRIIPVLVDKQADVPFFLKDLVYCDLSSESEYENGFGLLLRVLTDQPKEMMDTEETDRKRIAAINVGKELLRYDVGILEQRKAVWMYMLSGITSTVFAALFTFIVVSLPLRDFIVGLFKKEGYFLAGSLLGIICSVVVFLVARGIHIRIGVRKEGEAAKALYSRTALKEGEDAQQ